MSWVRWPISKSRVRCTLKVPCCTTVLTGTIRIDGRVTMCTRLADTNPQQQNVGTIGDLVIIVAAAAPVGVRPWGPWPKPTRTHLPARSRLRFERGNEKGALDQRALSPLEGGQAGSWESPLGGLAMVTLGRSRPRYPNGAPPPRPNGSKSRIAIHRSHIYAARIFIARSSREPTASWAAASS